MGFRGFLEYLVYLLECGICGRDGSVAESGIERGDEGFSCCQCRILCTVFLE
ncbi:hypothetical protein Natpe_4426 (plasmid) [Natrinema pellirubrum DSM 15624]|uniref:Uncharacterized protein n=1 Tax=Natrinema pellirubrum (strain DSM 15624 / CIP 106293 / JCM 10476 / NCIMB 786 / 157) TaxID=797303 RepID=L0JUP5_NATP1|nr:hypothetical protein Natpe_4426 [Natrinema pellirubrum DSM 15624]